MSNAKPTNLPPHLRGRIERATANNDAISLIDASITEAKAENNTVANYLKKQRERAAIKRLPDFERETRSEIDTLRADNRRLNTLITITNILLLIAIVLGAALCLL